LESQQTYSEDFELIKKAKKNRTDFGVLYEKYFERIYLFIFKRLGNEDIAGDICQTAMFKAMMNIHKYEDRGYPFSTWLYRIASNEVNLHFRKVKKIAEVEIKEKDVITLLDEINFDHQVDTNDQEKVIAILNGLKPEQTEIIELRFFFGYSFKEIAEFYNTSESSAKMKLYRLLEKIKKTSEQLQ